MQFLYTCPYGNTATGQTALGAMEWPLELCMEVWVVQSLFCGFAPTEGIDHHLTILSVL